NNKIGIIHTIMVIKLLRNTQRQLDITITVWKFLLNCGCYSPYEIVYNCGIAIITQQFLNYKSF
ncbi:MAG: hypothetical protein K2H30_05555, partial [Clostridia bacterium]|nr:hypothetical protein [Clostridia bacterium]